MEKTLRIRETSHNGTPAMYNGVDIGSIGMVHRGSTTPALVRETGKLDRETITFVHDTPHNRAFFLQRSDVETAAYQDGEWVVIPKSWLDMAFAPAKGAEVPAKPTVQKVNNPTTGVTTIQNIEGFEKIHKNQQMKAIRTLIDSGAPEDFKQELLNGIVKSTNPDMAKTVKEFAENQLKVMAT